jgi:predicted acetyltransferase
VSHAPVTFRPAVDADFPRLGQLSLRAYPSGDNGAAARADRYRLLATLDGSRAFVVERDGRHVAQYRNLPLTAWVGGFAARAGGLAGVAVAPEARRTGIGRAILAHHLERLDEDGAAWSFLYPFAADFYAQSGWAPAARRVRYRFAPAALPLYDERALVGALALDEPGMLAAVHDAYQRHCASTNGSLSWSRAQLAYHFADEGTFAVGVRDGDGSLSGYLFAAVRAPTNRPETLVVPHLVALDGRAERALLGFLSAQRDQADAVELDAPPGSPLASLLERPRPDREGDEMPEGHHPIATVYAGAMARIVDLSRALASRGYPSSARARFAFAASDPARPRNEAPVTLTVEDGRARVEPGAAAPIVRAPIGVLSRVLLGAMRLADAARLTPLSVDEKFVPELDALLHLAPPYPVPAF